jgi:hypothetical protein
MWLVRIGRGSRCWMMLERWGELLKEGSGWGEMESGQGEMTGQDHWREDERERKSR